MHEDEPMKRLLDPTFLRAHGIEVSEDANLRFPVPEIDDDATATNAPRRGISQTKLDGSSAGMVPSGS